MHEQLIKEIQKMVRDGEVPAKSVAECEGAREMRIFRKRNENVPEHFLCFGTFFE